ncbi:hypothetical protein F5Y14DRAFT_424359 [Nemania sp. NC0429]|nr:hypothetical protein F5Y14DRAFT_424359 [Nemania sp. NC0429]
MASPWQAVVLSAALLLLLFICLRWRDFIVQNTNESPTDDTARWPKDEKTVNIDIDFPKSIKSSDTDTISRAEWVNRLTLYTYRSRHDSSHNVLVINNDLEYQLNVTGVVEDRQVIYKGLSRTVPFRVVVFNRGTVLNLGDGGFINWEFIGNYKRTTSSLTIFEPCNREQEQTS